MGIVQALNDRVRQ